MHNIGYVLFNESVNENLIKSQVINLLKNISNKYKKYKFFIISFVPFYKIININKLKKLNLELAEFNIKIIYLPITIPSRLFMFTIFFSFFNYIYSAILLLVSYLFDLEILHCRSYFASSMGIKTKKINSKLKVIFDTRSLFVEENVSAGNIKYKGNVYYKWKKEEIKLLKYSDKIVGIAEPFKEHFIKKIEEKKIEIIPIFVDSQEIYFDCQARKNIRKELNIENKNVIIYVGSFYGWNDPKLYSLYFKKLISFIEDPYFLILTKDKKEIKRYLDAECIPEKYYCITSCSHDEVTKYLSAADYGIIVMNNYLDSHTRLGVKFIEYLACNLIPITNNNVGAAAKIVRKYNIGYVLNINDLKNTDKSIFSKSILFKDSYSIFNNDFNKELILNKYEKVYKELLEVDT